MASSGTQTCNWMCRRCWAWLDIWENGVDEICQCKPGRDRASSLLSIPSQKSSSRLMSMPEMVEMRWNHSGENQGFTNRRSGNSNLASDFTAGPATLQAGPKQNRQIIGNFRSCRLVTQAFVCCMITDVVGLAVNVVFKREVVCQYRPPRSPDFSFAMQQFTCIFAMFRRRTTSQCRNNRGPVSMCCTAH